MKDFPILRETLREAFATENDTYINDVLTYVVDQIARQCEDDMHTFTVEDIHDITPQYKDGARPANVSEAQEMLRYGTLILADIWKIRKLSLDVEYALFCHDSIIGGTHEDLGALLEEQGIDAHFRGWTFKRW